MSRRRGSEVSERSDSPSSTHHTPSRFVSLRLPSDNSETSREDVSSEYDVDPYPTSSPERESTRGHATKKLGGETKRLKIELPPSVIRSYLDDGTQSLEELRDVESLRAVADRAAVIVRVCKVSPVQAFYYCMDYPDGDAKGFLDLRRKVNVAFHLEGMRIMHLLQEEDRQKLVDTPLEDVLEEFRKRDARLMIRSALKSRVGDEMAMEILQDPACQSRVSIGGEETALSEKLLEFWNEREKTEERKERLQLAFADYGMQLRPTCAFCNAYIEGKVDADVEDVIGVSVIASRLRGRHKETETHLPACEEQLRKCIHHKTMPLREAVHLAMLTTRRTDKIPASRRPTHAALLAHVTHPLNYLPFSIMVLKGEITGNGA